MWKRKVTGVEGFRRADCAMCGSPVAWLGEAIRVDGAPEEAGWFRILHVCISCARRASRPSESTPVEQAEGRRAA